MQGLAYAMTYESPIYAPKPQNDPCEQSSSKECINRLVDKFSSIYAINGEDLKKVIQCESSYKVEAVGDGGRARNLLQFHKPTFDLYSKKFGEELDYNSGYDQIKLASWMWSKGLQYHWSCARIVGII